MRIPMSPPSHPNDPPPPRKSSWWKPSSGSWHSPWSLDPDETYDPPPGRGEPRPSVRKAESRRPESFELNAILQQPAPEPKPKTTPVAKPEPPPARIAPREPKEVRDAPSAPPESRPIAPDGSTAAPEGAPAAPHAATPSPPALVAAPDRHVTPAVPLEFRGRVGPALVRTAAAQPSVAQVPRLDGPLPVLKAVSPTGPPPTVVSSPLPPMPAPGPQMDVRRTVAAEVIDEPASNPPPVVSQRRPLPPVSPPAAEPPPNGSTFQRADTPISAAISGTSSTEPASGRVPSQAAAPVVYRSRRPQPPKAQPPEELASRPARLDTAHAPQLEAETVPQRKEAAEPLRRRLRSPQAEPTEVAAPGPALETPELPPQVGEWPPRHIARMRESGPWFNLLILSIGVFIFTVAAWIYWQDDRPPSEETLQLNRYADAVARPAAFERMRTVLTSVAPVQSANLVSVPASEWNVPELARTVEANGLARENLRDLLAEKDWHPRHRVWYEEDAGIHGAWTSLAILKQAEASYLMRRGEQDSAFAAALDLARLARSIQDLHAWPSYYDRSLQLFERACQSLVELLQTTTLNATELLKLQEQFAACAPSDEDLRAAMSDWYLFEKKLMLGPESMEPMDTLPGNIFYERPGRLFFKPQRTLALFIRSFHDLRDAAGKAPDARSSQVSARVSHIGRGLWLPNSKGEAYFSSRIVPYLGMPGRQSIAHAQHAVVLTLFAIRRYQVDFRRTPPKLLNLRPNYLKEIPYDPFSTTDLLRFDIATRVISSVGTNYAPDPVALSSAPLADPREVAARVGPDP